MFMAVEGLILVRAQSGEAYQVAQALRDKKSPVVKKVFVVAGPYDLAIFFRSSDVSEIGKFAVETLQTMDGVIQTLTMISVDTFEHEPTVSETSIDEL
jgi:DNA-binding Lrp family transcriptional regulator